MTPQHIMGCFRFLAMTLLSYLSNNEATHVCDLSEMSTKLTRLMENGGKLSS